MQSLTATPQDIFADFRTLSRTQEFTLAPPVRYPVAVLSKINLAEKFALFADHWNPRIVGELNGQHVKLVKFQGEFVWHHHDAEDEMFLVVKGRFRMDFREHSVALQEGEFLIVPKGVEHRPVAEEEVQVLLFEPAQIRHTGNVESERTVHQFQRI